LHCIIPGGALDEQDQDQKWISCRPGFLFPVRVISKIFRGTFVKLLRKAYQNNELKLQGVVADLSDQEVFTGLLDKLMAKEWCVYSKKPFNGAKGAVDYLAKYVYKTAISNNRISSCDDGKVAFDWRDYSDNNKIKLMKLDAHEFIRRFLTHVLPSGFIRIRSFGFLANSCKKKKLQEILKLLNQAPKTTKDLPSPKKESIKELMIRLMGIDIDLCPKCKSGRLRTIKSLPNFKDLQYNKYWDTS